MALATDLAEVIGGAIALNLLFDLPLVVGGIIIVGAVSMILLAVQSRRGQRMFEFVIIGLLLVITVGFLAGLLFTDVSWRSAAAGLVPRFKGSDTILLSARHAGGNCDAARDLRHSALARDRHPRSTRGGRRR